MRSKNSELMNKILEYINYNFEKTGRTPTYREIAKEFSITSGCVSNYIKEMAEKNMLENSTKNRGIRTLKMQKSNNEIEQIGVVGTIACGTPMFAEENIEAYISFPRALLGNGEFFILRANGESMIDAGIDDGDLVIIRKQETAEEGQIIVALINDEATLKRFYTDKKRKKIRLHPENAKLEDMYFDNIAIQGVAVKVIKDL
ncbi:MAG: transcriptional repressor LexA [Clostridia bacterium]|nr:transcriptional repressor LexA [Clostridia bacterium]